MKWDTCIWIFLILFSFIFIHLFIYFAKASIESTFKDSCILVRMHHPVYNRKSIATVHFMAVSS